MLGALADHSIMAFDEGFASARGDSHVALDAAIAGLDFCRRLTIRSISSSY